MANKRYDESSISVLDGIEGIRKRPGMYIGSTGIDGLHHLVKEIVDNSCDEAMNGHASSITVILHKDGRTVTVDDNGRGIPVGAKKEHGGKSTLEIIFTHLHSGGKFDGDSYKASGGLHGVGSVAVNALSTRLEARVRRGGKEYLQVFTHGRPKAPLQEVGPARGTGTRITFTPDDAIFDEVEYDPDKILENLETKTFLNKGLRIVFRDQVNKVSHDLKHDGGLVDYLSALVERNQLETNLAEPFLLERDNGVVLDIALQWTSATREKVLSYVNGIPTQDGGTHEQGFRDALVKALRSFMETHDLKPRGVTITAEDLREGLLAIVSLKHHDPQFQSQTKNRLNNPDVRQAVDGALRPVLEQWLHENRSQGEQIIARAAQAARARAAARKAAQTVRRKSATSSRLNLPGKLADCSSSDAAESELFIVEGDSAGGSAKQGRDRRTQAILPLRGKVLNAEQATLQKVLKNEELSNVVTALGCGLGTDFREDRLRYSRIILLMDADSDGHHITTLLLTFFFRHMRKLVERGYVYIAQPPLYRIVVGKESHWALDDADRARILSSLPARAKPEITRFKGLGEMSPKTLFQTTLDPSTRRLLKVDLSEPMRAENTISDLMGRDPARRYHFIMARADSVNDIDV